MHWETASPSKARGRVHFVKWQVQEHLPPSSGKYSVACQALASAMSRYSPWYKCRNDRALLGAEEVWFLGPNSLPS